jgi:hypothetical protein
LGALLLSAAWPSASAHAGPWTLPRNHFYLSAGVAYSTGDNRFDEDGNTHRAVVLKNHGDTCTIKPAMPCDTNPSNLEQITGDLVFEYGLLDSITLFGDFPFINSLRQMNPGGNLTYSGTNVGDLLLGGRVAILQAPIAFSLEARLTFPTGDVTSTVPTGSGDYRGELRLLAGKSFQRIPLDISGEVGFTKRGSAKYKSPITGADEQINYSAELYLRLEVALNLAFHRMALDRLLVIAATDYRASTAGATLTDQNNQPTEDLFSIYPPNSRLATVSLGLMWFFHKNVGLNLRYQQAVAGARLPMLSTVGGALFFTY